MYEKYAEAFRHHSAKYGDDVAVFYLVGKFYEMYDWITPSGDMQTSMKRAVDILGIQLSVRKGDGPQKMDGLFAGIPEQSLHKYAGMLTRQNWYVVIYDQKKDAKGSVKSRDVARVLSPGTHIENAGQDATYIAGIWMEGAPLGSRDPPSFGLTAIEMMTGRIYVYESTTNGKCNSWITDDGFHFFQVHPPKECMVWWKGPEITQPSVESIQRSFGLTNVRTRCQLVHSQGNFDNALMREEYLRKMIHMPSLLPTREALQLQGIGRAERALCSLLHTLVELYPSGPSKFHCPEKWVPNSHVFLGNQALIQLNMVTPNMNQSILGLFQKTLTPFGCRAMRGRILYPVALPEILEKRFAEIETIQQLFEKDREILKQRMQSIADLPRLHRRILAAELSAADVIALDQSYTSISYITRILEPTILKHSGWSSEELQKQLRSFFSMERALVASEDAYCFHENVAPRAHEIEVAISGQMTALSECLETIRVWANVPIDTLRLEFRDVLGPVITGNKAVMALIAKKKDNPPYSGMHIIAKKSSSSLEVPHLNKIYSTILNLRADLQTAIKEIIPSICDRLAVHLHEWDALEDWLASVDVSYTIWRVSKEQGFIRPIIHIKDEAYVDIEGLRHPLIERTTSRVEYVKHSVRLDKEGWLVYGMNASGKSSLMKAVGIAILLAQAGCYVPASKFVFSPFLSIFTRILSTDNIWAGLSSFAVEMSELREILERAGPHSLVLGDEVCSGTESVSATALVGASLRHLYERRAKFIFATHLHGILSIPSLPPLKIWHLKVRYDPSNERLIYERTLTPGPGSSLYGLEVARAMNLPLSVLDAAASIRRDVLGTTTPMEAPKSQWNSAVQRYECELCGHKIVHELEVHHIRQRRDALDGKFEDGTSQDDVRNLVVVCATCHDKHHSNEIVIQPLIQTSEGPMRMGSVSSTAETHRRSKWSDDELETIQRYLRSASIHPLKRIAFELKERENITISTAALRNFRSG
jgi:DNA mismatch repair protein MutS